MKEKIISTLYAIILCSCGTPFSVTAGFFGASVTVDLPNGITVPAKVVQTDVSKPVLMVPANVPVTKSAPVTTSNGTTVSVPVVAAPEVTQPILAVPKS